ncbi:MAG: tRNA (adenosine(37)-N6)-threonylcarbamoyltransferase complex ATPase subunit type 1 TsaE [Chthonomonas sp.]|nr:tRNA (adenosine(37)-N6)-threonylcarbamoyltransferase complex ATPase subunit type 1 TsaE [Chthonomonas sp.]
MADLVSTERELKDLAANLVREWTSGTIVWLEGELGAGKTTFVRGALEGLGIVEAVRSPTFNLIQLFETDPPVMHADFYRVKQAAGTGLEDYLESHLCLIEWPEHAQDLLSELPHWCIRLDFHPKGRLVQVTPPNNYTEPS